MRVTKHHGLGNDFLVYLGPVPLVGAEVLARRLCDRRMGIGADGLIFGAPTNDADVEFVLFNGDGSAAEISGNGIRCLAQAVVRSQARDRSCAAEPTAVSLRIKTSSGVRSVEVTAGSHDAEVMATVDMGSALPIEAPDGWHLLEVHPDRPVAHLSLGNPHAVVLTDDVASVDLEMLGSLVPLINLEIVEPGPEPSAITMRVHERGVGITLACGSGATASAVAARGWGIVSSDEVIVHQPGGTALVRFDGDQITLVGPSVFVGSIDVDTALVKGTQLL